MQEWKYRVIGSEIIDSESGKALSLEQVAKLLNDVPSVQQQCKDAQDSVNKAFDKLDDVALDETPQNNLKLVTEAITFLEEAMVPLDNLGWSSHEK